MLRRNLPQKSISQPTPKPMLYAVSAVSGPLLASVPVRMHLAGDLLLLRIEQAAGDRQLRARFHDAHAGRAHVRVGALRLGDQRVEHRDRRSCATSPRSALAACRAVPPPAPSASRPTSRPATRPRAA
jgi:hypothetical protein